MSLSQTMLTLFGNVAPPQHPRQLSIRFATSKRELEAAQQLRYRVFAQEMNAHCDGEREGFDIDRFDAYCQHLLVVDEVSDRVVGCYRILTDARAVQAGGYYSQGEFDLTRVLGLPGRFMEVGRTCVDPSYRSGAVIALL